MRNHFTISQQKMRCVTFAASKSTLKIIKTLDALSICNVTEKTILKLWQHLSVTAHWVYNKSLLLLAFIVINDDDCLRYNEVF